MEDLEAGFQWEASFQSHGLKEGKNTSISPLVSQFKLRHLRANKEARQDSWGDASGVT